MKVSPDVIIGDQNRLRQILINLLSNAVKFTDKGEVDVSVSSIHLDPLYEIHFEIKDTGIGIPADKLDRLFNSCDTSEELKKRRNKVADTSLSTSRELVELMSGRIWAESKLGEGSTFHFTIKTKPVPNISLLSGIQLPLDGKRILIVEGNTTIRSNLEMQTAEWGMIPITSAGCEEALGLIRSTDPLDIALLDVSTIDNGLSLGEEILKINKALPIVALTFAGQRIKPKLYTSTLAKPIRQTDLFNALKAALCSAIHSQQR